MTTQEKRIAKIRKAIDAENVSLGELSELQDIAATHPQLFADDPVLAEAAGIPEEQWRQGILRPTHTAGPWSVDYEGPAHLSIEDSAGRVLAFCNLQSEDGDEDEANARLIAAAPEMLEALRNVAEIMSGADYSHVKADMVRAICRRAISKAEGRAGE